MAKVNKKKTPEEIKKQKRVAEQKRRARIKNNPTLYANHLQKEKLRREKRKQDHKTVRINDLPTEREKRARRKVWRESAKKSRLNRKYKAELMQRLREDTPMSDSDHSISLLNNHEGQDVNNMDRPAPNIPAVLPCHNEIPNSPASRQKITGLKIARRNKYAMDKHLMNLATRIDTLQKQNHALKRKLQRNFKPKRITAKMQTYLKKKIDVIKYLERDENSKLSPGKKDTITFQGKKKQKRYLTNTLERLHIQYITETNIQMSYYTFTKYCPFYIVAPKVSERDTCLCVLHENFNLMTAKLKLLNVLSEKTNDEIVASVCCNKTYECMNRLCSSCLDKVPKFSEFDNSDTIIYQQWQHVVETRIIKGKEKDIHRTVKVSVKSTIKDLIQAFLDALPKMLQHKFAISHQYQAVAQMKNNLKENEAILHVDFSENYLCKYATETQSVHFGASRQQLSLHTCILYYCSEPNKIDTYCFCSVSDCLRHDAVAIYSHISKALKHLCKDKNINMKTLHILSDGPSGQYKNKSNFYLFSQHLLNSLGVTSGSWNFWESGHGKGAVDGVGAVVKRTADNLVAQGEDMNDFDTFISKLIVRSNIQLYTIGESDITEAEKLLPNNLKTVPETKKLHQITWTAQNPRTIFLRILSCNDCPLTNLCYHFKPKKGCHEYSNLEVTHYFNSFLLYIVFCSLIPIVRLLFSTCSC